MTDTMTIQTMLAEITLGQAQTPRYKVRAILDNGEESRLVGGFGTPLYNLEAEKFLDAQDINEKLLPSVEAQNKNLHSKIVRLEAYFVREVNVASLDLEVKEPDEVATTAGEWKPLD